jgi:hypothetical protein
MTAWSGEVYSANICRQSGNEGNESASDYFGALDYLTPPFSLHSREFCNSKPGSFPAKVGCATKTG